MVRRKLYVEGGGDRSSLRTDCRKGFSDFLRKAGLAGNMPRIVACGSRGDAYDSFRTALANGEAPMLLLDSESPVTEACERGEPEHWKPWQHLLSRQGDKWEKPPHAAETDCHMMVQCMESWFLADRETLQRFFGQGFNDAALPPAGNQIESIAKKQIFRSLAVATRTCKTKAEYHKGDHAYKLLAIIEPGLVTAASPWAKRFVDEAGKRMGGRAAPPLRSPKE